MQTRGWNRLSVKTWFRRFAWRVEIIVRSKARLISVMEIINRLRKSREVFIWIALFHPLLAQVYRRYALESIVFLEC